MILTASYLLAGKLHLARFALTGGGFVATIIDSDVNHSTNHFTNSTAKGPLVVVDINNDARQDIVLLADNADAYTYQLSDSGYTKVKQVGVQDPKT